MHLYFWTNVSSCVNSKAFFQDLPLPSEKQAQHFSISFPSLSLFRGHSGRILDARISPQSLLNNYLLPPPLQIYSPASVSGHRPTSICLTHPSQRRPRGRMFNRSIWKCIKRLEKKTTVYKCTVHLSCGRCSSGQGVFFFKYDKLCWPQLVISLTVQHVCSWQILVPLLRCLFIC